MALAKVAERGLLELRLLATSELGFSGNNRKPLKMGLVTALDFDVTRHLRQPNSRLVRMPLKTSLEPCVGR